MISMGTPSQIAPAEGISNSMSYVASLPGPTAQAQAATRSQNFTNGASEGQSPGSEGGGFIGSALSKLGGIFKGGSSAESAGTGAAESAGAGAAEDAGAGVAEDVAAAAL